MIQPRRNARNTKEEGKEKRALVFAPFVFSCGCACLCPNARQPEERSTFTPTRELKVERWALGVECSGTPEMIVNRRERKDRKEKKAHAMLLKRYEVKSLNPLDLSGT